MLEKSTSVKLLRIVLVSPGDVAQERDIASSVVEKLNRGIAELMGVQLKLWRWETGALPGLHAQGVQGMIDDALDLETADIVVGVFWARFGTPVHDADSGTEHELRRALGSWQQRKHPQVMLYFNLERPAITSAEEAQQLTKVHTFKDEFRDQGLHWEYYGAAAFGEMLFDHLTRYLKTQYNLDVPSRPPPSKGNIFAPPVSSDTPVDRATELGRLDLQLRSNSFVSIEGLSGTGKTYLAAAYAGSSARLLYSGTLFWYQITRGETVDDVLDSLQNVVPLVGNSALPGGRVWSRFWNGRAPCSFLMIFSSSRRTAAGWCLRKRRDESGPPDCSSSAMRL